MNLIYIILCIIIIILTLNYLVKIEKFISYNILIDDIIINITDKIISVYKADIIIKFRYSQSSSELVTDKKYIGEKITDNTFKFYNVNFNEIIDFKFLKFGSVTLNNTNLNNNNITKTTITHAFQNSINFFTKFKKIPNNVFAIRNIFASKIYYLTRLEAIQKKLNGNDELIKKYFVFTILLPKTNYCNYSQIFIKTSNGKFKNLDPNSIAKTDDLGKDIGLGDLNDLFGDNVKNFYKIKLSYDFRIEKDTNKDYYTENNSKIYNSRQYRSITSGSKDNFTKNKEDTLEGYFNITSYNNSYRIKYIGRVNYNGSTHEYNHFLMNLTALSSYRIFNYKINNLDKQKYNVKNVSNDTKLINFNFQIFNNNILNNIKSFTKSYDYFDKNANKKYILLPDDLTDNGKRKYIESNKFPKTKNIYKWNKFGNNQVKNKTSIIKGIVSPSKDNLVFYNSDNNDKYNIFTIKEILYKENLTQFINFDFIQLYKTEKKNDDINIITCS